MNNGDFGAQISIFGLIVIIISILCEIIKSINIMLILGWLIIIIGTILILYEDRKCYIKKK